MTVVFLRMYPDFWQHMLRYTNQMEDMCSFAQISRYFYRVTSIDFQKLCYKNMICRFKGETWATAFSNNGTLVDLLNQKEYQVETIKLPEDVHISTADVFGYRKYVGFVNPRREFVVIRNETGKMDIIFQSQFSDCKIWLCDDIDHVRRSQRTDNQIYDINTKKLIFEGYGYMRQVGIDGILFSMLGRNNYISLFDDLSAERIIFS
ncbi:unnamed protein product [Bursaphelenchus okinawaensis]|uniref:Uncharacterized protein n=1 Tax=Bursaphelenchus okinawaensis TaxID=465554 RepID=A0A811LAM0_9BILA|nr:unnamed protein product [Bursaphelenchus okinawaensis]CAG9120607.1 unnamed protein product [Bursaphelenchus okinawaensis]